MASTTDFSNFLQKLKVPSVGGMSISLGYEAKTPPPVGSAELLMLYTKSPWLRAVVNKISKAVACTDWRLYKNKSAATDDGDKGLPSFRYMSMKGSASRRSLMQKAVDVDAVDEIKEHVMLDLLYYGNEYFIGEVVFQVTQTYLDLLGEAYWLLQRNGLGTPVGIWPISPVWIKGFPSEGDPFYQLSVESGTISKVPVTEIIMFRDPDPRYPYGRGSGIAKSLGDELESDEYAAKHIKSFFYNRARPDIIISGDNISADDAKRLEIQWNQNHQGFWRAFKPLFMSRKVDIKEMTQTFENTQMTSLRKYERDTVINVYGIPPEKLGIVNESKRSTINAADLFWAKDIIEPRVEMLRSTIQRHLVPMFSNNLLLDYITPVIQDQEFELQNMKASPWAYTINEWRKKNNMPTWGKRGEMILVPKNSALIPVEDLDDWEIGDEEGPPEEEPAPEETPDDNQEDEEEESEKDKKMAEVIKLFSDEETTSEVRAKVLEKVLATRKRRTR